jgi:hypothetical protein
MTLAVPRTGPCAPWIDGSDVAALVAGARADASLTDDDAGDVATSVSDLLYKMSGEQFTGNCGPVTVRPVARPTDQDTRGLANLFGSSGYMGSWGVCTSYGQAAMGTASHYGCSKPPMIELGAYPVTEVQQVLIDGVVIPADEYYLQDYKVLVRQRPTAQATPTERWGWPTCQLLDLPDTEPGTMSVTFMYGSPPPQAGIDAAKALAKAIALQRLGLPNELPTRTTSVNRQGIASTVLDIMDYVAQGRTGIYLVDLFIKTYNPSGSTRRSLVWSPDTGRPRRQPVAD